MGQIDTMATVKLFCLDTSEVLTASYGGCVGSGHAGRKGAAPRQLCKLESSGCLLQMERQEAPHGGRLGMGCAGDGRWMGLGFRCASGTRDGSS
jgi:hypothetical protein